MTAAPSPACEDPVESRLERDAARILAETGATSLTVRFADRPDWHAGARPQDDLEILIDTIPHIAWRADPEGRLTYVNARYVDYIADDRTGSLGDRWLAIVHPDDRELSAVSWAAAVAAGREHHLEHRLKVRSGAYHWFVSRGIPVRTADGTITGWFGTATDIETEKRTAEALSLLSRELVHRIKNIFAVVSSLVHLSFRGPLAARGEVATLQERIAALASAHEHVRPQSPSDRREANLLALVTSLMAPYRHAAAERIRIAGDDLPVGPHAAGALALVLHEQATNAVKYGALADLGGEVSIRVDASADHVLIRWTETGGPPVAGPPRRRGFGTDLAARSVADQLQGRMDYDWRPEGLAIEISVPALSLHR
ncbi:HWE histidine kinase domain-containing protein [Chthonobacter rhizosphaerae]|uniref:HWE histidine kinase domain-containing protein n=1 Tax=Chthonobacter rhizosphaerae TaxID=2735553 RepID=UPI0015EE395E|nr:HWE histidine kinase domain-containing protein [Chthonobacter rhizosphaerae]